MATKMINENNSKTSASRTNTPTTVSADAETHKSEKNGQGKTIREGRWFVPELGKCQTDTSPHPRARFAYPDSGE